MRVLLISANTETLNMIPLPLGLNMVAVAAKNAGHDVQLVDLMGSGVEEAVRKAIKLTDPQVVGISVRNVDDQRMADTRFLLDPVREVVALCRRSGNAPVVVGGAGYSIFPASVLRYVGADMGICGEGEIAFPSLLHAIDTSSSLSAIPGLCAPGLRIDNPAAIYPRLEELPLPDPSLWPLQPLEGQEVWVPYQTRRGCPMNCSYCSTASLEGTLIRKRPVKDVVNGISRHVETGFNHFYFVDNVFNLPQDYARELCRGLCDASLDIRWRCILYPGFLDRETVKLMARAGCVEASLGFESGSLPVLRSLNKKYSPEQVRETSVMLAGEGIVRNGFLLLGGPGETRKTVMESLDFADSLGLDMLKLTMGIRIYPNTQLQRIASEEGVVSRDDDLLFPRFYMAKGLEEWLRQTVQEWMSDRPYCTY